LKCMKQKWSLKPMVVFLKISFYIFLNFDNKQPFDISYIEENCCKNLKIYEMKVGGWNTEALFKRKYKLE
jgi:hypothetical protein